MTAEEKKEKKQEKRVKKAMRSYRCRFLKNLLIWFVGVISSVLIFALVLIVALKFIPVDTLTGDETDKYVSSELADKSVLDLVLGINSYTVDDLPVVVTMIEELKNTEVMDGKKVKDFVDINTEMLKGTKITEIGGVFEKAIKVTATIDNTVGTELLGDFGKIETLTTFKAVGEPVDVNAQNFNPKLYYYDNNGKFERAFNDDKSFVNGVNSSTVLYYGAITQIPVTEAIDLIDETFGRIEIVELLSLAGASNPDDEDNMISKIFAGKTISDLGSFGPENIILFDVLGGQPTDDIYKILESATGIEYDKISLQDLTGNLQIENVTISTFLGEDGGEISKVLSSALGGKDYSEITLGDLSSEDFKINNVVLSTFLGEDGGEIGKVLSSALGGKDYSEITLGDLSSEDFKIDNVVLSTFLGEDGGEIGKVLSSALNGKEYSIITIGDLSSQDFNIDNVVLSTFLGEDGGDIGKVLSDALNGKEYSKITIGDLSNDNFNINKIKLSLFVLEDSEIASLLSSALGGKDFEEITVGDLSAVDEETDQPLLDVNKILLKDIMTNVASDSTLATILVSATPATSWDNVTLSHLSSFNADNIALSTVMTEITEDSPLAVMIVKATSAISWASVNLGHLKGFNVDNIVLDSVLPVYKVVEGSDTVDNREVYKILLSATGVAFTDENFIAKAKELNINSLSSFNSDNINISTFIDIAEDSTLAKLIVSATPAGSWAESKISHLKDFSANDITLSTVMTEIDENGVLVSMITSATGKAWAEVNIGHLNNFNVDNIVLDNVLPVYKEVEGNAPVDNQQLYRILLSANGIDFNDTNFMEKAKAITIENLSRFNPDNIKLSIVLKDINSTLKGILEDEYVENVAGVNTYEDITLGHLNNFSVDALHLYKVLPSNMIDVNLKNILIEITGVTDYDDIYVEDLHKGDEDILSKIKLKTVLGDTEVNNPILKKLIENNVSVNGIGSEIDALLLKDVYGTDVFKAKSSSAPESALWFKLESDGETYTMVSDKASATHYLNSGSGIWLLLCFDASETVDGNGRPISYKVSKKDIASLSSGTGITDTFVNATIRQLVDAGIVKESDVHEKIMALKLSEVLKNPLAQ